MADSGPDWPSIVAAVAAVGAALVTVVLWVPSKLEKVYEAITASRHKTMGDLQTKWKSFDEDIDHLRKDVGDLKTRVAVLEVSHRRGAD